jgi:hypothetical protein
MGDIAAIIKDWFGHHMVLASQFEPPVDAFDWYWGHYSWLVHLCQCLVPMTRQSGLPKTLNRRCNYPYLNSQIHLWLLMLWLL